MRVRALFVLVIVSLVASVSAQVPQGWKMRVDQSQDAEDPDDRPDLTFTTSNGGFHVKGGPAGVFWNPANTGTGDYTLKATFRLNMPSNHTNFYGLVFGGSGLDGASQRYTYFVVAQNGMYLVRQRNGDAVTDVQRRTAHEAVRQPGADGTSENAIEVRVAGDTVSFVINGTVVHTAPKSSMPADGIAGFRVNHVLDVGVQGFAVS
jgi:hypothetical protein